MKMKALIKKYPKEGVLLEEIPVPSIKANEVLVRVKKAAICGTDVHIFNWDEWAQKTIRPPQIIGHEFVGVIAEKGELVTRYQIGDRVCVEGHITCGVCRRCRAGLRHLCTHTMGLGVNLPGGFAEYVVVPADNLWAVSPQIPDEQAAVFDPLGNAVHSALCFDMVGEDVLITGAGPIGCMAVGVCRMVGARYVVITDLNDYRLGIAEKMGATRAVNINRTPTFEVMKELGMIGFDIGLEMSGDPSALQDIVENMIHGGEIGLLGIMHKNLPFPFNEVVFKGLTLKGIYGRELFETWYKMTNLIKQGLNICPVITHHFPMEEYQKAFETMCSGKSGKVILSIR